VRLFRLRSDRRRQNNIAYAQRNFAPSLHAPIPIMKCGREEEANARQGTSQRPSRYRPCDHSIPTRTSTRTPYKLQARESSIDAVFAQPGASRTRGSKVEKFLGSRVDGNRAASDFLEGSPVPPPPGLSFCFTNPLSLNERTTRCGSGPPGSLSSSGPVGRLSAKAAPKNGCLDQRGQVPPADRALDANGDDRMVRDLHRLELRVTGPE
jgi:hypothetical protein